MRRIGASRRLSQIDIDDCQGQPREQRQCSLHTELNDEGRGERLNAGIAALRFALANRRHLDQGLMMITISISMLAGSAVTDFRTMYSFTQQQQQQRVATSRRGAPRKIAACWAQFWSSAQALPSNSAFHVRLIRTPIECGS